MALPRPLAVPPSSLAWSISSSPNSRRSAALVDGDGDYADASQNAVEEVYWPCRPAALVDVDGDYADASQNAVEEVYGPGVEALVMDEDQQDLEKPIVAPPRVVKFKVGTPAGTTSTHTSARIFSLPQSSYLQPAPPRTH